MASLKDKIVLITGASAGLGEGAAYEFAVHGSKLALHGRNEESLRKVAEKCCKLGLPQTYVFQIKADLDNDEELKTVIDKTVAQYGQLDVLVNNAGIMRVGPLESVGIDVYDSVMRTNTRAAYYLTHLAVPHLKKTKGNIVNVSSLSSLRAFNGLSIYSTSKAAMDQLTKCSALDLAPYGIRVNAVNPGTVITELQRRAGFDEERIQSMVERSKDSVPLGRIGEIADVAKAIRFLASEDASFITGATLPVDGGKQLALLPELTGHTQ